MVSVIRAVMHAASNPRQPKKTIPLAVRNDCNQQPQQIDLSAVVDRADPGRSPIQCDGSPGLRWGVDAIVWCGVLAGFGWLVRHEVGTRPCSFLSRKNHYPVLDANTGIENNLTLFD